MSGTGIGARVPRLEDRRFLTGRGRYTDDLNRPGQLHAFFLRSPHPHARIAGIDAAAARSMPGIAGIFTGEDIRKFDDGSDEPGRDYVGGLICGWLIHSKDG